MHNKKEFTEIKEKIFTETSLCGKKLAASNPHFAQWLVGEIKRKSTPKCGGGHINPYFAQWLVGLTDGDGTFSFSVNKKKGRIWNCTFKISAALRNGRMLQYIKTEMGCGSINYKSGAAGAEYRIRDRRTLLLYVVPLFAQFPLYTSKSFYYKKWLQALHILECPTHTTAERDQSLQTLYEQPLPPLYKSPAWDVEPPTRRWISGFVEAEGSFFITNKAGEKQPRLVHSFGCTQKLDQHCLEFLRKRFHLPGQLILSKRGVHKLESSNFRAVEKLYPFFLHQFHGVKSLQLAIWGRSLKRRGDNKALAAVQSQLRRLRRVQIPPSSFT